MGSLEQKFTLHVPSSTQNLALIREFVNNVGAQAGLGDDDVSKLELAVDEACTNVIEHAHRGDISKDVVVRAEFRREDAADRGGGQRRRVRSRPPAGRRRRPPRPRGRKSGGLGYRVMKTLMDEVSYEIVPAQTTASAW